MYIFFPLAVQFVPFEFELLCAMNCALCFKLNQSFGEVWDVGRDLPFNDVQSYKHIVLFGHKCHF